MPGDGFYIAPFVFNGEQSGIDFWEFRHLSKPWLDVCSAFLNAHGAVFDVTWDAPLSSYRTQFTSMSGSAMLSLYVLNSIGSSMMLLAGLSKCVEREVSEMFITSLAKSRPVSKSTEDPNAFAQVRLIDARPLAVVIPWPDASISEQERDVVRELGLHLAGAFFAAHFGATEHRAGVE